ncbi:MAG TPA: DNA topoisomerase VI subunit B [Methanomassiliicoccales archaeon]|nr:DNA topoisomerase VI subunit B [Methanomassiliicoccales archaeon]
MASVAEQLAKKQKEISVSEFFEKNRQILGFDSMRKALIMGVKEAVDNSLDACEETSILPEIIVCIDRIDNNEYKVTVEDNGPGIVARQVPHVFGRLLYGSRFHAVRQSRGQQGIGISATVMYGQITTGRPATVKSKTEGEEAAVEMDIIINTKKNKPDTLRTDFKIWDGKDHGTRIEFYMKGRYVSGRQSVLEYLKQTAIVNPHATLIFIDPDGRRFLFERVSHDLPSPSTEIKPHPMGIELGTLMNMATSTREKKVQGFLTNDFSRISTRVAKEILEKADINPSAKPSSLKLDESKRLINAISQVKIMAPQTDCLSPIGETLIKKGLKHVLSDFKPEFYTPPITRDPKVYGGNPFLVEVGIVYGGDLPKDQQVTILRFGNRVPLLYQQGACVITKSIEAVDWRRYGLEQRGGKGIPYGPAIILVHVASTKLPFTSEAKEAIADMEEIRAEIELALRTCGRKLKTHLNKKETKSKTRVKFEIVKELLPQIAEKSARIVGKEVPPLGKTITKIMNVVWIDDSVDWVGDRHRVSISIYNYTPTGKKFNLHSIIPNGAMIGGYGEIKPKEIRKDGKVAWELKRIASTEQMNIVYDLIGLESDDYDDNELYISGINPVGVIGVEPLPGDWDIEDVTVMEEEPEEVQVEEEEEEVDYDESGEVLIDD